MSNIIEKILWMLVPLLLSAVVHMWSTLQSTREAVNELRLSSELARERIKQEVLTFAGENREKMIVLEEKIKTLEKSLDK